MIRRTLTLVGGFIAVAALVLAPSAATAEVPTSIALHEGSSVSARFGDPWTMRLTVSATYPYSTPYTLLPADGTVDIYLSGIAEAFAVGLPIQQDGSVYFSQSAAKQLLAPGIYDVTSIFNPSVGSNLDPTQLKSAAVLTITSVDVSATVAVDTDYVGSPHPVVTASLAGDGIAAIGGAPSGTWEFSVVDAKGDAVFDSIQPHAAGATEPVTFAIDSALKPGGEYTMTSRFIPVDELATGLVVSEIPDTTFTTPGASVGEVLMQRIAVPIWLAIGMALGLAALVTAAILLGRRLIRSRHLKPGNQPSQISEGSAHTAAAAHQPLP